MVSALSTMSIVVLVQLMVRQSCCRDFMALKTFIDYGILPYEVMYI